MNYLGQPVFLFPVNWRDAISRQITFDLRPEDVGFGAEYFTSTQSWSVNQWQFNVDLTTPAQITAFNAFMAGRVGPLAGFWLPIPLAAARVTNGASTSIFSVAAQSLSTFWQDRPDSSLLFTFADGSQAAAQIQSVVPAGATETVTLTAPLPQNPDAGTQIQRLQFVRLSADKEKARFVTEGYQIRTVTLIELPTEYAGALVGLRPIYLYHFWAAAPINTHWRYTSFAAPVASAGQLYTNIPVDFAQLDDTCDGSASDLKIVAKPDVNSPFGLFLPVPFSGTLNVEIFAIDYTAPDVQTLLFGGRVVNVEDAGSKLTLTCESRLGYLKRKVPRFLKGQTCNNVLYDVKTCRALRANFSTGVNIVNIGAALPPTIICTFQFIGQALPLGMAAADFFQAGLWESGIGPTYEARTILSSVWNGGTGQLTLTLNLPLQKAQVGVQAQITAGCDHTAATCQTKFKNYMNFSGFQTIPVRNPTLKGINANPVSQGGK
jgi:uncharacterized phage protein (TIGR02218 family)